jgi:hypothetical protein
MNLVTTLPWLLSAVTIVDAILCGNRWRYVWLLSLGNSALWTWWSLLAEQWGMMPLNLFMAGISIRNHIKWNRP